jgi:hypothetical protein
VARAANEALRGEPDGELQDRVVAAVDAMTAALRRRQVGR